MPARLSSVAGHLAEYDAHALAIARQIVAYLNWQKPQPLLLRPTRAPLYDAAELDGIIAPPARAPSAGAGHQRRLERAHS